MGQYDIPLSMPGGFKSLADAKAHRSLMQKLSDNRNLATELADKLRAEDQVDISSTPSDLFKDLAPGKGHVIFLSQQDPSKPLIGAELNYNPQDNSTRSLKVDLETSHLTQAGSSFKLEEGEGEEKVTTYFKYDDNRGVVSVLDADQDVPRIFGDADPKNLVGKTLQGGIPILIF